MNQSPLVQLQPGQIDPRILNLSYSSILSLHACPRKFELYKLQSKEEEEESQKRSSSVTFSFGHVVGLGIQLAFQGLTYETALPQLLMAWEADLLEENEKQNKSFWKALVAVQKFYAMMAAGIFDDWELLYWKGAPAVELSFRISFPDSFKYRGFVDAVLRNRITGAIRILEVKTTSATYINQAMYKNSAQALGYSVVLDVIAPKNSDYEVMYLPYLTKSQEFEILTFPKTYLQRALWIRELLLDIETIKMYHEAEVFPMRGESCFSFYRECEYLNLCQLSNTHLTKPLTEDSLAALAAEEFQIELTLNDLIDAQMRKSHMPMDESEIPE